MRWFKRRRTVETALPMVGHTFTYAGMTFYVAELQWRQGDGLTITLRSTQPERYRVSAPGVTVGSD